MLYKSFHNQNMDLRSWKQHEQRFAFNGYDGSVENTVMRLSFPASRVCVVAVHGVNHYRSNGALKPADLYTGGLTLSLALSLRCNEIIVGKRNRRCSPQFGASMVDHLMTDYVNYNPGHVVLDLHGAVDQPDFDVAIGLSELTDDPVQQTLCKQTADVLSANDLTSAINYPGYTAKSDKTVTHRLRNQGHSRVLQLELTRPNRDVFAYPTRAAKMQTALGRLIQTLER